MPSAAVQNGLQIYLRQINDSILKADAYLFKPADSIDVSPTDDNGTPMQKDEAEVPNPPDGVPGLFDERR